MGNVLGIVVVGLVIVGGAYVAYKLAEGIIYLGRILIHHLGRLICSIIECSIQTINQSRIYHYFRRNANGNYDYVQSNIALNNHNLSPINKGPNIPQFKPIQMTDVEFDNLQAMCQKSFVQKVTRFSCPITYQIMKEPTQMKCCKNIKKDDRWAEKAIIQFEINKNKRCIMCQSSANIDYMIKDQDREDLIRLFRLNVAKAYVTMSKASLNLKQNWKKLIDNAFGPGYTEKHLQKFNKKN